MAVEYTGTGEYLTRTASVLDYNNPYTVMLWGYVTNTLSDTFPSFFSITNNVSDGLTGYDFLGTTTNGDYLEIGSQAGSANDSGGTQFTNGTWVHVCLVRPNTTSLLGYVNGALRVTASSAGIGARAASGRMSVGKFNINYSQLVGLTYAMKCWQAALSADEVAQEVTIISPHNGNEPWGWWPMFPGGSERVRDYSGSARDWSTGGVLSDGQEPPVSWGGSPLFFPYTAPPAGRTTKNIRAWPLGTNLGMGLGMPGL